MWKKRLGLVLCTVMSVTTFGLVTPAAADTLSAKDDRRDMLYLDVTDGEDLVFPGTAKPERRNGDLKGYTVRYGAKRISASLRFRELNRTGPVIMVDARFRLPQGGQLTYDEVVTTARRGNWPGRARSTVPGCAVHHKIDYRRNTVRVSFPRGCFASPRWIQFNAVILFSDSLVRPSYLYTDAIDPVFSANPTAVERFSPRIRRP